MEDVSKFKPTCPYCWTRQYDKALSIASRFGWKVWEVIPPKPKRNERKRIGGYVTARTIGEAKKLTGTDKLVEVKL
jgi:hypothetical protein